MRKKCRWNRFVAASALALAAIMGGCKGAPAYQGSQRDVLATYKVRRLTADLPPTIRVPAAVAAGKGALLSRGYAIKAASMTEDSGHIEGAPADPGILESIWIDIRQTSSGTRVRIIAEPLGNQVKSRAILDAMLSQLGL